MQKFESDALLKLALNVIDIALYIHPGTHTLSLGVQHLLSLSHQWKLGEGWRWWYLNPFVLSILPQQSHSSRKHSEGET